jgi:hypothetical protein
MKIRRKKKKKESTTISEFKIDFSFRREVFFIIAGALIGAIVYVIPITVFAIEEGSSYYLTWIVFGHIAGVYSPIASVIIAGFMLHVLTATCIGIIAGLFLYKTNILNISKPSNGLKYGLFVGSLVFVIFAIPVQEFVLGPEFARTIGSNSTTTTTTTTNTSLPAATESSQPMVSKPSLSSNQIIINQLRAISNSLIINLVFGTTLGLFSSFLSRKFGARYRCPKCDISFSRVDSLQQHLEFVHGSKPIHPKRILILGGGFAGVETAGELNEFLRDVAKDYYHNIEPKDIRVIIIQSGNRLLPEMSEELTEFAMRKLIQSGVEVILNARVIGATTNSVKLNDDRAISTSTIIWSGGVASNPITEELPCEHDKKSGRIIVDKFLEIQGYPGVFAIGDCAFIIDPNTGHPYPPTAQHAIREGTAVANNIISMIEGKTSNKKIFDYKTKGMMATIGKRNGVGAILGIEVQGFIAWWIWRTYYLANLPTLQKKIRVMADWTLDVFFKRDVTMLRCFVEEQEEHRK